MADEPKKKSRREMMYDKGKDKPKAEEKKPEAAAKPDGGGGAKPAADAAPAGPSMGEKHSTARTELHKRHEAERKDFHGNQREALRKMVQRHDKEIKALQVAHEAEIAGAAAPMGEGNAPPADGAGAAAAAPPVAA